jgi:lipid II:glycine glycyltransferase (peptidoglycan interpeptide bridge formation enzyme)
MAYIPWGPAFPNGKALPDSATCGEALRDIAKALAPALPSNTTFLRFDPPWTRTGNAAIPPWHPAARGADCPLTAYGFVKAACDVQPPDTVLLDLSPDENAILSQMKNKWRYNIRLGGRKVTIRQADEAGLDDFYRLFLETADRDHIAAHSIDYYRRFFTTARNYGEDARLYLADYDGVVIAGIVTLFAYGTGTYLYGASSGEHRNVMAPYALQWQAIRDAKTAGCTTYDLFGIPPDDNPAHPMAGLYRFKTGFGGAIIHRPGSWDYPLQPTRYRLFHAAEALRKRWRDAKKRR